MKIKHTYVILTAVVCLFSATGSNAQHYLGVRGGIGGGTANIYPPQEKKYLWGLYSGGVSWKYYSAEKFVGGIQADLLLMQQGYKVSATHPSFPSDTTVMYSRTVNSVMLPFFWQPHVYFARRTGRAFLNLGVTLSANISSTFEYTSKVHGVIERNDYIMKITRDNFMGYGLCGGAGAGWSAGRVEILGEFRYYIGLSDLLKNRNKYEANPLRSPLYGMQIHLGVYVRLGSGGILSLPTERVAERMLRRSEEIAARRREAEALKAAEKEQAAPNLEPDLEPELKKGNEPEPEKGNEPEPKSGT